MGKHITLLILGLLWLASGHAASKKLSRCQQKGNTICQKIITLNPYMNHKEAYKLSNHFHLAARKYDLDPDLLISIAFQESRFNTDIVRKTTGLVFDDETGEYREVKVGSDFCMMQIHLMNIKKMKLNVNKLLSNPAYCLNVGAKILSKLKQKYRNSEGIWWTRYNARHHLKQEIYYEHVTRHLEKLRESFSERHLASEI